MMLLKLCFILLLLNKTTDSFRLYYTEQMTLQYDCLYYKVLDDIVLYTYYEPNFQSPYQIISYCIRPSILEEKNLIVKGDIFSEYTFEELKFELKITNSNDLFIWQAPIDLIELYETYLNGQNLELKDTKFYNCTSGWFGKLCQYSFDKYFQTSFHDIVKDTFTVKIHGFHKKSVENVTFYEHFKCERGSLETFIDWREICDGIINCLNDGIDELNCYELEINQCEENEYRCRNGMCIPEELFNDDPMNPDCLDSTDEDIFYMKEVRRDGFITCYRDPAFRCEEADHPIRLQNFVCGDGERARRNYPQYLNEPFCFNGRQQLLENAFLSYSTHSNYLTKQCWRLLICLTSTFPINCSSILCEKTSKDDCTIDFQTECNLTKLFFVFPHKPILQDHIQFVYPTNRTITIRSNKKTRLPQALLLPTYICYDTIRCPFLPSNSLLSMNDILGMMNNHSSSLSCQLINKLGNFKTMDDIIEFFQSCLSIDQVTNQISFCNLSSTLFYHCPNTTKCISKHRILDGINDCYDGSDEMYSNSCELNDVKFRFRCSSRINETKYDIEIKYEESRQQEWFFPQICNGFVDVEPILIDGEIETDETNCDNKIWPCSNQYTRCDYAWSCLNGADEAYCGLSKVCPQPGYHECISPDTYNVVCLPIDKANDGKIDCLGATDERLYCRENAGEYLYLYRCWNETICELVSAVCRHDNTCPSKNIAKQCQNRSTSVVSVLIDLDYDESLFLHKGPKYFMFNQTSNASIFDRYEEKNLVNQFNTKRSMIRYVSFSDAWFCNRGILIPNTLDCLCPPSYYGNRCQFQNERISLTLRFQRLCAPNCHGIFSISILLIEDDEQEIIHSYEYLTYSPTLDCNMKYNLNLLYKIRPKNRTKNYHIRIDAYNRTDLTYYSSWIFPVKFLFLPVYRLSVQLTIPSEATINLCEETFSCGKHGICTKYENTNEKYCHCYSEWFGRDCSIHKKCNCSSDSLCIGYVHNESICICPLNKFGPRCFLRNICDQSNTCPNNGLCIADDERISEKSFQCLYYQESLQMNSTEIYSQIEISFSNIEIPQLLLIYLITVEAMKHPWFTTFRNKISFDQKSTIVYTKTPFHMIFIQIDVNFYLIFIQEIYQYQSRLKVQVKSSQYCPSINQYLNSTILSYPILRRVKYYHLVCQKAAQHVSCFHDNATFMCLCTNERHANCFPFDFSLNYQCNGKHDCKNNAKCYQDRSVCRHSTICICPECFYGTRCQFSTKGFGLSLDAILGYQIRPRISIHRQLITVKISIILIIIISMIGFLNSLFSFLTFQSENLRRVGCGLYLLSTSIISFLCMIVFNWKFWIFLLSQMSLIENSNFLHFHCMFIEYFLRSIVIIGDWLNACVAIERIFTVINGVKFNKRQSKQIARWIIVIIILLTFISMIYDPLYRKLVTDQGEERIWCLVQYRNSIEVLNSTINIIHFIVPFLINFISALIIIINTTRIRFLARKNHSYKTHFFQQLYQYKHLIISPIILVLLALPRLIIAFISGCMKSFRDPWLYLIGYFISFIPPALIFIVFVLPSDVYRKEFQKVIRQQQIAIRKFLSIR
ncbi:unnamed protein product [Adineta ricciae]|uniref:Uncharacterized protein n=1 Tax=Adineta ricciae TaxID=249248 RepID=A0A814Y1W4_ADIRI|nr:unnamed protein product [Adineta ricciae]CAF1223350.1 unnamed protein product [Adineta ricciae]